MHAPSEFFFYYWKVSEAFSCHREFKQITTAAATSAAVTKKVRGEYVSMVCSILSLAKRNLKET